MGGPNASRARFWLMVLAVMTVGTGCRDGLRYSSDSLCLDGSSPDLDNDPQNCGKCGLVCEGLHGKAACQEGVCVVADPRLCDAGFHDADGIPTNGCECAGPSPLDCRTCLNYEVPMNGVDDDCLDATPDHGANRTVDIPWTRTHCGARGASCLLPPGAADVQCALSLCSKADAETGECGVCSENVLDERNVWCAQCIPVEPNTQTFEHDGQCFDGIDNDRNGRIDDGPRCEVLLTNATTIECNAAAPSAECPPNSVKVPSSVSDLGELDVELSYDFVLDRYEVSRGQYAAYLLDQGHCMPDESGRVPTRCRVDDHTAMLPVGGVTWCEAYDYCTWAGDRLPTLAEFYRAAGADGVERGDRYPIDAQGLHGEQPACDGASGPATTRCGADGPARVDGRGGDAYIGARAYDEATLRARAFRQLSGNMAEWLFDIWVDWCDPGAQGLPPFRDVVCNDRGQPALRRPLLDFAPSPEWRDAESASFLQQLRVVAGGGFQSEPGADDYDVQQAAYAGVRAPHQGFRCARTVHPDDKVVFGVPYDSTVGPWSRTTCDGLPEASVPVPEALHSSTLLATELCVPALADFAVGDLDHRLGDPMLPLLAALEEEGARLTRLSVQTALDAGSELLWLRDHHPIIAHPAEDTTCTAGRCPDMRLERPGANLLVPTPFEQAVGLSVQEMSLGVRSPCLDGGTHSMRISVALGVDTLAPLLEVSPDGLDDRWLDALDEGARCLRRGDDDRCQTWWLALDLGFVHLDR